MGIVFITLQVLYKGRLHMSSSPIYGTLDISEALYRGTLDMSSRRMQGYASYVLNPHVGVLFISLQAR